VFLWNILLFPLVAEVLKVNKMLYEEDIYSWYTFANNIFKEFDLNIENYSNIDKSFEKVKYSIKTQLRKVVAEKYRNKSKEKLSSYSDESNLFLYSKLKSSILGSLTLWFLIILFLFVRLIYSLRESDTHLQQLYKCYIIFVDVEYFYNGQFLFVNNDLYERICSIDIGSTPDRESSFYVLK
jgi:hypothetical protein